MEKQHLTYFKIENFKRFDSFEMSNLGQFNLIVGDNNVGKTSVLEGLTFDSNISKLASNFLNSNAYRNRIFYQNRNKIDKEEIKHTNFWELIFKEIDKPIIILAEGQQNININIEIKDNTNLNDAERKILRENNVVTLIPNKWLVLTSENKKTGYSKSNTISMTAAYFEYIDSNAGQSYMSYIATNIGYDNDMLDMYYKYFNPDKELKKELEGSLSEFIPNLEEIRPHRVSPYHEVIGVILRNSNSISPLTVFGDGTVKLTRIMLEILFAQGGRLMIDEIGSGIHFTRLKGFWKIILASCRKHQVQLFATTHSLECQQAFIEALQDDDMKQFQSDARNITMIEDKEGKVKSVTYTFEEFEFSIENNINTRGGHR